MADCIILAGGAGSDLESQTVTSTDVYPGRVFLDNSGSPTTGTMPLLGAQTIHPTTSGTTLQAGRYLTGAQTIAAVTTSGISAGNIKHDVNVKVGRSGSAGAFANVTGTFGTGANATADKIRSGYKGYVNDELVNGTLGAVSAKSWTPAKAATTFAGSTFYSGAQTLGAVQGNAATSQVVSNMTFSSTNGTGLTGGINIYSGDTSYTPTTVSNTTVPTNGLFTPNNITVKAISATNFIADYIEKGVTIKAGNWSVTGSWEGYVVDTKDVFKYGVWGPNCSLSTIVPTYVYYSSNSSSIGSRSLTNSDRAIQAVIKHYRSSAHDRFSIFYINKQYDFSNYSAFYLLRNGSTTAYSYGGGSGSLTNDNQGYLAAGSAVANTYWFYMTTASDATSVRVRSGSTTSSAPSGYTSYKYPTLEYTTSSGLTGLDLSSVSNTGYILFTPTWASASQISGIPEALITFTTTSYIQRLYFT